MASSFVSRLPKAPRLGDILTPEANSFGFLRFMMATLVLISHSYLFSFGTSAGEPLHAWTGWSLGECAVQVFFFMSGLMVAQSFDRGNSIIAFATARALRIFPALIVCVLLTALVLGPLVTSLTAKEYFSSPVLAAYLAKTLTLSTGSAPLPGVFETVPYAGFINSSLWTLKYEVICYTGLAFAGLIGLFNPRWRIAAGAAVAVYVAFAFVSAPADPKLYTLTDNIRYFSVFFGTGVAAYLLRDRVLISGFAILPLFAVFVALLDTPFDEFGAAVFFGYSALWTATKVWGPFRAFCNEHDTSYGIYIFAGPVQQALLYAIPAITPLLLSVVAFAIVFPLAMLSWLLIERPALRLRPTVVAAIKRRTRFAATAA